MLSQCKSGLPNWINDVIHEANFLLQPMIEWKTWDSQTRLPHFAFSCLDIAKLDATNVDVLKNIGTTFNDESAVWYALEWCKRAVLGLEPTHAWD